MEGIEIVRAYYDGCYEDEWARLERHPVEFALNTRFMARYIESGQRVLDIGGGPGRYSMWLAARGCDVTLADLSKGNVAFAIDKAAQLGLPLEAVQANALDLGQFKDATFDHVLLMGPLYHLTEEKDRMQAVREALRVLKPGGTLHVAFISSFAGPIYAMKDAPESVLDPTIQHQWDDVIFDRPYAGLAFTHAYFIRQQDVLPFMAKFKLQKLHLFGSEGVMAPCEPMLMQQPKEIYDAWVDLSEKLCERENLLCFTEHFQYVGRKLK